MCGIIAIRDLRGEKVPLSSIQKMSYSISHRGPDDAGVWLGNAVGLAHRRLSILDLSPGGHQPMTNESQSICLVFNGEIYNYLELRSRLEKGGGRFNSRSDTEVILRRYERDPANFINDLRGMFALVVWDAKHQRLIAARDRLGIKPLYYYHKHGILIIASEIKAILAHPSVSARPRLAAVHEYLRFGHGTDSGTWYEDVQSLPPGCTLEVDAASNVSIRPYWHLQITNDGPSDINDASALIRSTLEEAISLHTVSDVPVGAHLSGGIDSSTVVGMMAKQSSGPIPTFSGAFSEGGVYDERHYIRAVTEKYLTSHHEIVPSTEELQADLERLIWHLDYPIAGPGCFSQWMVNRLISKAGIKVVCGGQGGDEIFAGYPPYLAIGARAMIATAHWPAMRRFDFPAALLRSGIAERLIGALRRKTGGGELLRGAMSLEEALHQRHAAIPKEYADNRYARHVWIDIRHHLPALLHVEDRTSMAWSIESRVPLLDHVLVERAMSIPFWLKIRGAVPKRVLRDAVRGVVPDMILDRLDKRGFPTPIGPWFSGRLKDWVTDKLYSGTIISEGFVNATEVRRLLVEHTTAHADHSSILWKLLCTELWFRHLKQ